MTAALIVDDEPAILRLIAMVLRDLGFETLTATDAESATEVLKSSKPDLVVTDVRLPGISGVELAKRIKASRRLAKTPVLLMSAFAEPQEHEGDGFIAKPFDISELKEAFSPYIEASSGQAAPGRRRSDQKTASPGAVSARAVSRTPTATSTKAPPSGATRSTAAPDIHPA